MQISGHPPKKNNLEHAHVVYNKLSEDYFRHSEKMSQSLNFMKLVINVLGHIAKIFSGPSWSFFFF